MIDFRNFNVLTFDCYGTLIDWESGILATLDAFRRSHSVDATDAELLAAYSRAEAHIQRGPYRRYRDVLREVMAQVAAHFRVTGGVDGDALVRSLPTWQPFPDTFDALRVLSQHYKLAVISNVDDDLFAASAARLQTSFEWVITAEQAGAYKPALEMFYHAREVMGVHPSQILHVAQSRFHDIAPAKTLGWSAAWVDRARRVPRAGSSEAVDCIPDMVVPDLATLARRVRERCGDPKPAASAPFIIWT